MTRRLQVVGAVGIALILLTWLVSDPPSQRRSPQTNGPMMLLVSGQIKSTNELTAFQLEGLTQRYAMTSPTELSRVTNALMIQITNRGQRTIEMWGHDSTSPSYDIYVDGTNGLERLVAVGPERVSALVYLGPTQSLSFPVMAPAMDKPWHVSVSYRDSIATGPPAFVRKQPAAFERLVDRTRALVPFLRRPEPRFYYTMSDSIHPPERPNLTTRRMGARHGVDDTNRASSTSASSR